MKTEETKRALNLNELAEVTGGVVARCPYCGSYIVVPSNPDKALYRYCKNCNGSEFLEVNAGDFLQGKPTV